MMHVRRNILSKYSLQKQMGYENYHIVVVILSVIIHIARHLFNLVTKIIFYFLSFH